MYKTVLRIRIRIRFIFVSRIQVAKYQPVMLCLTDINIYPKTDNFWENIFLIEEKVKIKLVISDSEHASRIQKSGSGYIYK